MFRLVVALCLVGAAVCGPPVSRTRSEIEKFRDFLESSRTEHGVRLKERMSPQGSVWENSGKYQGDIILDDEQIDSMVQQYAQGRNAYIWPGALWPGRTVVYEFAAGVFTQQQRNYILETMHVLEQRTCIRFRPRNPGEFNYVLLTGHPDGCYAHVGYWFDRGVHIMNLALDPPGHGCFNFVVIIHEWLHIIGFFHMQSTYTRDNYVRINWQNIGWGMEYAFERYESNMVSNLGLPYEYDSCMHYGTHAFSFNGRPTIEALRPHTGQMGQMSYVTGYDLWRVDRLYGCAPWRKAEDYQAIHKDQIEAELGVVQDEEANFEAEKVVQEEAKEEVVDN